FIAFRGSVPAGVAAEGSDQGVAEFTSRLLLSGTRTMSAAKLADRLEGIGATLEFHGGEEVLTFQGRCTREPAAETVRILVEAHVGPEGLILAATGDVDRTLLDDAIATPLSRLRGDEGGPPAIPPPPPHRSGTGWIPMPHKTQVDIAIGAPGVPRPHADYYALNLANLLFGRIGLYG